MSILFMAASAQFCFCMRSLFSTFKHNSMVTARTVYVAFCKSICMLGDTHCIYGGGSHRKNAFLSVSFSTKSQYPGRLFFVVFFFFAEQRL
jgi:hypothetical protein